MGVNLRIECLMVCALGMLQVLPWIAYVVICVFIMFPTQSDMAIPIENVWQMLARATRVIFSHITLVALWVIASP